MAPRSPTCEEQFSRSSSPEGKDLAWLLRILRILKAWLAKSNWVSVSGKGHKTLEQAHLKGKISIHL